MSLNLIVPKYLLPEKNIFNLRSSEWNADAICNNVKQLLSCSSDYGITVNSVSIRSKPKSQSSTEIKKSICKILEISCATGVNEDGSAKIVNFEYDIPWLLGNHFFIGSHNKVPVYQLYDMPVIAREDKNMIKVRTNIQTFTLNKKNSRKTGYHFHIDCLGKEDIPFAYIVCCMKTKEQILSEFGVNESGELVENITWGEMNEDFDDLVKDIQNFMKVEGYGKKGTLGKFFSRKTNEEVIDNILLVTKIDIFTKKFMKTDNVIDEIIWTMKNGSNNELDFSNKRIRFTEYVIYFWLCKDFYNMILNLKHSRKGKFSNNSKTIISNVNQSDINQFDSSMNPLSQIALMTKVTVTGPGGFDKKNVPSYLKDLHHSMFGRVCPADTGDRENCGTSICLVPTIKLNDNMSFKNEVETEVINSVSIINVPFLEHDDATRLQMSSSQQRHAVMLDKFDMPLVQSGTDGMYTKYTEFIFIAEEDGHIVYRDNTIIIAAYKTGKCKAFDISHRKIALSVSDFYHVYYNVGSEFKAGDIIAESNYLSGGRICLGRNLLTAVMVYHGYNYEDSITISDKLVKENVMTSVHYLDLEIEISPNKVLLNLNNDHTNYKPLPVIGDVLKVGDIYAKVKSLSSGPEGNVTNTVIFDESHDWKAEEDCIVTDVQIYANKYNSSFPQYKDFIENFMKSKRDNRDAMIASLSKFLTDDELNSFLDSYDSFRSERKNGNYRVKGEIVDGLIVQITAVYKRPVTIGDKIGNRHGNKGVICQILPEKQMPMLPDGRHCEIVINPLGIISRMNIGQVFELHLAMSVTDLKKKALELIENGSDVKSYILEYIKIIDNTNDKNYTAQMVEYLNRVSIDELKADLNNFYVIQPPYESIKHEHLIKAMAYTNTQFEFDCYDPMSDDALGTPEYNYEFKKNITNQIAFGYMYFMKLNHIAKDKIAARGVGPYTSRTCQPIDGKSRKGGQRLGEMEVWALAAHGAVKNLDECLTTKSDSIKGRNKYMSEMIHNDDMLLDENDDDVSQSVRLFQDYLKVMGINPEINED